VSNTVGSILFASAYASALSRIAESALRPISNIEIDALYTIVPMDFSRAARKMARECPAMRARQACRVLGKPFDEALRPLGLQVTQLPLLCGVALFGEPAGSAIRTVMFEHADALLEVK
jgi:hypothetical protein